MSAEHERLKEILVEAAGKATPEARAAFLDATCRDDAALRQQVEALLSAHECAGDFLEKPVELPPADFAIERTGAMIGRYKLLEKIGEGGFGTVFMAEQTEPVHRKVALKIIKAGMDTREVIARFEAERQALALMDHPNIARVLDAGATETGRPYFVMELVRGIPITDYSDQKQLPTVERLRLFMKVCAAVQHAHQKGIIHRDLKPTNILVTVIDGEAAPKVIDFGVAKALGQKLTEKTLFTSFQQMIGTPAYMSPEQAELSGVDVDTRSDIYSLGVLLYELLTGVTPFDADTLRRAALDEIRRLIRETEPPKPSTRLRQALVAADVRRLKSKSEIGNQKSEINGASSRRLLQIKETIRLVRGDLDWIAMKALEKDRARRYETASALVEDIQNHLAHNPVVASPPSAVYRVRKFLRRHRWGVTMAGSLGLVLVLGLTAALIGYAEARRERDRAMAAESKAEAQRQLAEAREKQAQTEAIRSAQVAQFMKQMLQGIKPRVALGRDTKLLREILDQTAVRLKQELAGQPEIEGELRAMLGIVYRDLAEYTNAATMLHEAVEIRRKLYGDVHTNVAISLNNLADVFYLQAKYAEAEALFREGLAIRRKLFGNEHADVANSLASLAIALTESEKTRPEAEATFREALAIQRKVLGNEHLSVANTLMNLGILLHMLPDKQSEAEACLREALNIQRKRYGEEHPDVAFTLMHLGCTITAFPGRMAEAETMLREALAVQKRILGDHPQTTRSLAILGCLVTNTVEQESLQREALRIRRERLGNEHQNVAETLVDLAGILLKNGKLSEAESAAREALAIFRKRLGTEPAVLANSLYVLAGILLKQGKLSEVEPALRETLVIRRKLLGNEHPDIIDPLGDLGFVLVKEGKLSEAEPAFREVLTLRKKLGGGEHASTPQVLINLAVVLLKQGKYAEAEAVLRETLALRKKLLGSEHPATAQVLDLLTDALQLQGKTAEAVNLFQTAAVAGNVQALNKQAWLLATGIDPKSRDGQRAVTIAEKAVAETKRQDPAMLETLAAAYAEAGQFTNAINVQKEAMALLQDEKKKEDYASRVSLYEFGIPYHDNDLLARRTSALLAEGKFAEAELVLREELALLKKLRGSEHQRNAELLAVLGDALQLQGKSAETVKLFEEAAAGGNIRALNHLAWLLATGIDRTERDGQKAVLIAEKAVAETKRQDPQILDTLAAAYAEAGQFTNAVKVQKEAIALLQRDEEKKDYASRLRLYEYGIPYHDHDFLAKRTCALLDEGKSAEAEPFARECLILSETLFPDVWETSYARSLLGGSLLGQKKYAEAEPLLVSGYEGMKQRKERIPAPDKPRLKEALQRVVQLYEDTSRTNQAAEWKQKLAEFEKAETAKPAVAPSP